MESNKASNGQKWTESIYYVNITRLIHLNHIHSLNSLCWILLTWFWPRLTDNRLVKRWKINKTGWFAYYSNRIDEQIRIILFVMSGRGQTGINLWSKGRKWLNRDVAVLKHDCNVLTIYNHQNYVKDSPIGRNKSSCFKKPIYFYWMRITTIWFLKLMK